METQTAKKATDVWMLLYDTHTKTFISSLEGISAEDAANRMGTKANHMGWIAGSLVHQRYEMIKALGGTVDFTENDLFKDWKGIQDGATYPTPDEYIRDWQKLTPVLKDLLGKLSDEQLNGPDPLGMPGGEYTLFDTVSFLIDRESYCIGQLGIFRRLLGKEAIKFD